jgi:hypothetical protein
MRVLSTIFLCTALVACGTWVNPSNPAANYGADMADCQARANAAYPPAFDTQSLPSVTDTNCALAGSTATCTSTTSEGATYKVGGDKNLGNRISAQFACMDAKGWRVQSENGRMNVAATSETSHGTLPTSRSQQSNAETLSPPMRSRYGYLVGYDIGKRILSSASLLENSAFLAGLQDGLEGRMEVSQEIVQRMRAAFRKELKVDGTLAAASQPSWELYPARPQIDETSNTRTLWSYVAGTDAALIVVPVKDFVDFESVRIGLVDTVRGSPLLDDQQADQRRREFTEFVHTHGHAGG